MNRAELLKFLQGLLVYDWILEDDNVYDLITDLIDELGVE